MRLTEKDKLLLVTFAHNYGRGEHKESQHLSITMDGERLDGNWFGGGNIAEWAEGKVVFHDLGSRTAQMVQRALKKYLPPGVFGGYNRGAGEKWIAKAIKRRGALHRALHVEGKIPLRTLKSAARKRGRVGSEARLALTLRRLSRKRRRR